MELNEISDKVAKICDIYLEKYNIQKSDDWFLLKIQEELGELTSVYLKLTQRGRTRNEEKAELEKNFQDEIADVFAFILLFARHKNINVQQALKTKWFKHLE